MATQTDVQRLIQNLTPSAVNNGNPNTVYNTAPVPTTDGQGRWSAPTVSPAASIPALNLAALPAWIPPTGGGGIVPGPILPQLSPLTPGTGGGGGTGPLSPVIPPGPTQPPTGSPRPGSLPLGPGPGPGGTPVNRYGTFGSGGMLGPSGGGTGSANLGGGSFSWQALVDALSEPLIPGDLFHSGTQEWDVSNGLMGALDSLVGPLASQVAGMVGNQTGADWYRDHLLDIARNQMANNQNEVQANTNASIQDQINETLERMFPSGGGAAAPGRHGRANSAGATTIAEGAAARDMLSDMKLQQFLNFMKARPSRIQTFFPSMN